MDKQPPYANEVLSLVEGIREKMANNLLLLDAKILEIKSEDPRNITTYVIDEAAPLEEAVELAIKGNQAS